MLLCPAFRGTQGFELRSSYLFSQHLTYKTIYSARRLSPFHAVPFFVSLLYTDRGCVVCSDILDTESEVSSRWLLNNATFLFPLNFILTFFLCVCVCMSMGIP